MTTEFNSNKLAAQSSELSAVELPNSAAIELSEDDLDSVSGGFSIDFGSASDFFQRNVTMGQQTFAGPNGAGTTNLLSIEEIASSAQQFMSISQ